MDEFDNNSLWDAVLAELQVSLSPANFQTWFRGKTWISTLSNTEVEINCSSPYNKAWIEQRYLEQIREIVERLTGRPQNLLFSVSSRLVTKPSHKASPTESVPLFTEEPLDTLKASLQSANINEKYSFSNFLVGQCNQLAYAVAKAVGEDDQRRYNPLLIYGGVGVGKTHLLQALAQSVLVRRANLKVLYSSSETFTNDMVEAIQKKQTIDFRSKYRKADLLLIDDIQFIAGRESTQEEFFHTFNHLYERGKQIILACDRDPSELASLQERLKSRFVGGMVAKIDTPDQELKEAILLAKSKEMGMDLDFNLIRDIAASMGSSIRELVGALLKVTAAASLTGKSPDRELAKSVLTLERSVKPTPGKILRAVADHFSIPTETISSNSRGKAVVLPRQISMYLLRHHLNLSFYEIARLLGGKDHSTVIYSVARVENLVENGGEVRSLVDEIERAFKT